MKKTNKQISKAIKILKQYADESQVLIRGTSDLSPLEEWLLLQLTTTQDSLDIKEKEIDALKSGSSEIWRTSFFNLLY